MKKTSIIIMLFSMLAFLMVLSGCDVDGPLRKKMLDYYSDDDNYANYVGTIVSVDKEHCYVEIVCQDDEMPNQTQYTIYGESSIYDTLRPDDEVILCSSPMYFYNSHNLPIVYLEKQSEVLLEFEEGKENLLEDIRNTFKERNIFEWLRDMLGFN